MSRDPKINPEPGDALCSASSYSVVFVDAVTPQGIAFRLWEEGREDTPREVTLDEWRRLAADARVLTLAERIAAVASERNATAERLVFLDRRLAWLRGVA